MQMITRFIREDDGQDMIEYSLLAAFISIVAYVTVQSIGQDVSTIYGNVDTATGAASS
jgi:Flp pilus assembly pilin Flp